MTAPARKPGRPVGTTKPDSRRRVLRIRVSPEETARIESAARAAQTTVSEYVRGRATEEKMLASEMPTNYDLCGVHHYFSIGVHEAVERVEKSLPANSGFRVISRGGWEEVDTSRYTRVGQVRVRTGDPEYVLLVYRT